MSLIKLNDGVIVSDDEIVRADRSGNYTHVWLRTHPMMQILDEDMKVWNQIERVCASQKT